MNEGIPSKMMTINYKEAPWVTPDCRKAITKNIRVYKKWVNNGRKFEEFEKVKSIQRATDKIINKAKSDYVSRLSNTLCDPLSGSKPFWGAYKKLCNKKKSTNIPPIQENGNFITNFNEKAIIFNDYFADQCRPLDMISHLPPLKPRTHNDLSFLCINPEDITKSFRK